MKDGGKFVVLDLPPGEADVCLSALLSAGFHPIGDGRPTLIPKSEFEEAKAFLLALREPDEPPAGHPERDAGAPQKLRRAYRILTTIGVAALAALVLVFAILHPGHHR